MEVGSWVVVERHEGVGDSVRVRRIRTVLTGKNEYEIRLRTASDRDSTESMYVTGSDDGGAGFWFEGTTTRETLSVAEVLPIGTTHARCILVREITRGGPPCGNDPIAYWQTCVTHWIDPRMSAKEGKLKSVWGPDSTFYNAWYLEEERAPSVTPVHQVSKVVSLREDVRVGSRKVRCIVVITQPLPDASTAWRMKEWLSDEVPGGVVRRIM